MIRLAMCGLLAACAGAQMPGLPLPPDAIAPEVAHPANLSFENGEAGKVPPEWSVDQVSRLAGYSVALSRSGCHSGKGCAILAAGPQVANNSAGALMQVFSAQPYRGKLMRLRAWVKVESESRRDRVHLMFLTDGDRATAEFLDKRGVRGGEWTLAEVEGKVPWRADLIHIAFALTGKGKAWIDDVTFEEVSAPPSRK
jgi:hypothetical protein